MTKKKCYDWQRKAETLVYRNDDREDETFLRLNTTAFHHEKAKTRILFGDYTKAHSEIEESENRMCQDPHHLRRTPGAGLKTTPSARPQIPFD